MKPNLRNGLYVMSLTPGILVVFGNLHGGFWVTGNLLYSILILGLIDIVSKPFVSSAHSGDHDTVPNTILWLHLPLQLGCVGSFLYGVRNGIISDDYIWYAALSMAVYTGSGAIVAAHEFIHKKQKTAQWAGKVLLFTAGNFYFFIEHLRVHHKWVGTARDSATARRGQSVYGFFITSTLGQIKGAWKLECQRCAREAHSIWGWHNYMVRQCVWHILFDTALFFVAGPVALAAWFVHCIVANFLLEYVNYIEHYGLTRAENERATEQHSWQSDKLISRFVLIDLSRHADHHFYASKPYHTLQSYAQSPVLPLGYPALIIPALVPPLWRKIVHPILDANQPIFESE
jgi:alkane 1-monooxygenase